MILAEHLDADELRGILRLRRDELPDQEVTVKSLPAVRLVELSAEAESSELSSTVVPEPVVAHPLR